MTRRAFLGGTCCLALASVCLLHSFAAYASVSGILKLRTAGQADLLLADEDIASLPWERISTQTVWTEGVHEFAGPLLRDVLLMSGLSEEDLRSTQLDLLALNDFKVSIPAEDGWEFDPILARTMDGVPMLVRGKGPLWLVYPRDKNPSLQTSLYDERWIWQLSEIEIVL